MSSIRWVGGGGEGGGCSRVVCGQSTRTLAGNLRVLVLVRQGGCEVVGLTEGATGPGPCMRHPPAPLPPVFPSPPSPPVFLGATSAARRWKLRGWTGSSGPVSNVPLWELLLDTLSAHTGSIKFIKVPSHVDILGNNEADTLADQGRLSHPRCPVLKTPSRDFTVATYTPPTKRRCRNTAAELDSVVQVLNFPPHKDGMGGSVA